jgi:hypothetical protein
LFLDVNLVPIDPLRQQLFLLGREVADAPLADVAIVCVDMSAGMVGPGMTARRILAARTVRLPGSAASSRSS